MAAWNPDRYLQYTTQRALPFHHLVAALFDFEPRSIADLGCGPGTLTATLLQRWPEARVVGIDSSEDMIDRARTLQTDARLRFERADMSTWQAHGALDLILSNAAFHWVRDQTALLAHLRGQLEIGGTIAFQVPDNFAEPSHRIPRKVLEELGQRHALRALEEAHVESPERYRTILEALGLTVTTWQSTYRHVLAGEDPVLEWLRGTTLRPALGHLDPESTSAFLRACAERLRDAYPATARGTLYPFKRLFVIANDLGED